MRPFASSVRSARLYVGMSFTFTELHAMDGMVHPTKVTKISGFRWCGQVLRAIHLGVVRRVLFARDPFQE